MNKQIKFLDVSLYPDMQKFHLTKADNPQKASELIYQKYRNYLDREDLEIDLRDEDEW